MDNIPFSVLLPTYSGDDLDLLEKAIKSILTADFLPDEIIIAIDGPLQPQQYTIINFYENKYESIKTVWLSENKGLAKNLNNALQHVTNEIVIRCDADDVNLPHRFRLLHGELYQSVDIVSSQIKEIDSTSGCHTSIKKVPLEHDDIIRFSRYRNPINHMAVGFRKSVVIGAGGYPDIYLKEDFALWLKLLDSGARFKNLDEVLVIANAGDAMLKRRSGINHLTSEWQLLLFRRELKMKSLLDYLVFLLRICVIFSPQKLKRLVYKSLRSHVK